MEIVEIDIEKIMPSTWNSNEMGQEMRCYLRRSMERFGPVVPLVVREVGADLYETVGGAQRLEELRAMGAKTATCVVLDVNDAEARLLSQALNHISGSDNPGLRGVLVRSILSSIPLQDVIAVLPETSQGLEALTTLGQEAVAERLLEWDKTQKAKLKHLTFQVTPDQLRVVEKAIRSVLPRARQVQGDSPNIRGTALYVICCTLLKQEGSDGELR